MKSKTNQSLFFTLFQVISIISLLFAGSIKADMTRSIEFSQSQLTLNANEAKDGNDYTTVEMENLITITEPGYPALPVMYEKLLIPSDMDVESITIINSEEINLNDTYNILPVQEIAAITPIPGDDDISESFTSGEKSIYSSDDIYPADKVVKIADEYYDGANHIVIIAIYPLQYKPKSGNLIFNENIQYQLNYTDSKNANVLKVNNRSDKNQEFYDRGLKRMIDNPEDMGQYQERPANIGSLAKSVSTSSVSYYEYVIITTSALKPYFETFVNWKIRKGLDVGIVTTSEIYSNYTGDLTSGIYDNPGKIRQYLTDAWSSGTVWVLIGGDAGTVPCRYGRSDDDEDGNYKKIPADLYYSELNGDWDSGDDSRYGEPTDDNLQYVPELYVGRIPVASSTDIDYWVEKLLLYEINPGNGNTGYLTDSYSVQGADLSSTTDPEDVVGYYPSTISNTHQDYYDDGICNTDVVSHLSNNDYGIWNLYCHGAPNSIRIGSTTTDRIYAIDNSSDATSWGAASITLGDGVDNIDNKDYYPVCYSVCCNVGCSDNFDSSCPGTTMAEALTVAYEHNGAVALLGNTRAGYQGDQSESLHRYFCYEIDDGNYNLGVAEANSKSEFYSAGYYRKHELNLAHSLIGCPETELWTATPSQFSSASVTDNSSYITVNAGVSGCTICVSSGDDGASYKLTAENVSSYNFTTSVRPLYITITKHNYLPYTAITGGMLASDQVWFEKMLVLGDLLIDFDTELEILKGTEVSIADDAHIFVNGKITAIGTEDDPIVFDALDNDWDGLIISVADNGSRLNYCEIANCEDEALRIYNCDPKVYNCYIHNSETGILVQNTATPTITNCSIKNNYEAIVASNDGNPYMYSTLCVPSKGLNDITSNTYCGLTAENSSTIHAGIQSSYQIGYNSIYNNSNYAVTASSSSSVIASQCYWNAGTPISDVDATSTFSYLYNKLSSKPTGTGSALAKSTGEIYEYDENDPNDLLLMAADQKMQGDYSNSKKTLEKIIDDFSESNVCRQAMNELYSLMKETKSFDINYFNNIKSNSKSTSKLQRISSDFIVYDLIRNHEFKKAITACQDIIKNYEGTESELNALYNLVVTDYYHNDCVLYEKYLSVLNEKYPEERLTKLANNMVLDDNDLKKNIGDKSNENHLNIPEKFVLHPSYPNPFNPTTTIAFGVPEYSKVNLKIYNIRGQEVWTMSNNYSAGYHKVRWTARDMGGNILPSGVYLVKLNNNKKQLTQKVLLVK